MQRTTGRKSTGSTGHAKKPARRTSRQATPAKQRATKPAATAKPAKPPARLKPVTSGRSRPAASTRQPQRAVFIDVENTSSEATLERVLDHLGIDRAQQPTRLTAIGNWRSVGAGTARLLARHGAELMHSAPAVGVRDWSDLWIAVAAGRWLAAARPGDRLDLVSDDRAFDAVGQAAVALGVVFNRLSYRNVPGAVAAPPKAPEDPHRARRRGGRRRRGGHGHAVLPPALPAPEPITHAPQPPALKAEPAPRLPADDAHTASQEQIRAALARLTGGDPNRWINLDLLANTLRDEGFTRPPGSPRLITRVRHVSGVEVSPMGMLRLVDGPTDGTAPAAEPVAPAKRTSRTHRGRRRRGRDTGNPPAAATASGDPPS